MAALAGVALLLGAMSALLLYLGEVLGGPQGLVMGFVFAAVTNFVSYWFSDRIVLSMYRAQEVGPDSRLYQVVERLARRAGLPMPKVYVIPEGSPNAFATGRNPSHAAVAATEGILRILSEDELEGVIAHELAHVKHRDILTSSVAATLAAAIMMVARMAMFFGGGRRDEEKSPGSLIESLSVGGDVTLAATAGGAITPSALAASALSSVQPEGAPRSAEERVARVFGAFCEAAGRLERRFP